MAKHERKADRLPEGWLKTFIEAYDIKTIDDIKNALADQRPDPAGNQGVAEPAAQQVLAERPEQAPEPWRTGYPDLLGGWPEWFQ